MRSLSVAATGMLAQQLNVETISNNIANMNTTAFKRQRAEFQDLLYQNQRRAGANSSDSGTVVPSGVQIGLGVKTAAIYRIMEQGNLTTTGNTLDVALQGKGFFQIELPSGEIAYTRAGSFQLSAEGKIVTADGYAVKGGGTIPKDAIDVTVNANGEVLIKQAGQSTISRVGQFELSTFPNEGGLQAMGDNNFVQTSASGDPVTGTAGKAGFGSILQGFLETSNVNTVSEITNLITAQRAYEMNSKVIQASDEMLSALNQLR
ncbi:MAG: flagellar basal-body rod protein FlgG [Rhodospirillales bacterium]|nr:flagellar basal-body rod protein FlgG [Rhodospirillales bacterium]